MIKITKHIRVSVLTAAVFVFCVIFHYPMIFYITYAVMALHEAAHTVAAVCIGLKVDYVAFLPFGVNLRLKNKMVCSIADEIILYIAGPLVNALAAVVSAVLCGRFGYDEFKLFYVTNIMLFMMNMLPAMPLDGGIILKKILTRRFGQKTALRAVRCVSAVVCAVVTALGIYAVTRNARNFSLILFAMMLLGNLFTQSEKYETDFVRELVLYGDKKRSRIRHIAADADCDFMSIAENFSNGSYHIVYLLGENGEVKDIKTETEIIGQLIDGG